MRDIDDIVPRATNRAFIVGQTGCGKTTLAERLLQRRTFVACIDPKGLLDWSEFKVFRSLKSFCNASALKVPKRIYRPSIEELDDATEVERFFQWCYLTGNWTVYVDEAAAVTEGQQLPKYYKACLTRGREHGVETWSSTQRPMNVPNVIMSESEDVYTFFLKMQGDRDKVGAMCAIDPDMMYRMPNGAKLPKHHFYYASQESELPVGPLRLRL